MAEAGEKKKKKHNSFTKGCFFKFTNIPEPQPSLTPHMEESGKRSTFNNERQGNIFNLNISYVI